MPRDGRQTDKLYDVLLLVRFLLIVLASRFRRRIGPFDDAVVRFTVLPTDCDLNLHLNGGRFVSFMDIARVELLARMRIFTKILRRGWRPIMGAVSVRYRRSVLPFERFAVRTRVAGWDDRWFYIEHKVEKDGELCAIAYARTVIRGKSGTIPPPDVIALSGETGLVSPPLPEFAARWRDAEDSR